MRIRIALLVGAVVALVAVPASPASSAGIVTHAWMATDAVAQVGDPALQALLDVHRDQVRAGAQFPDGGYYTRALGTPGGDYGEEAHWQRFVNAYTEQIRARTDCGDLTNPQGPCAAEIAHLMGVAGHGMGDEVFDWLFEPNAPDFKEEYLPAAFGPFAGPGGIELQMDLIAIAKHGRPTTATPPLPAPADVLAAFHAVGRTDIRADAINLGETALEIAMNAEQGWVAEHAPQVERAMPWTSSHLIEGPGGVNFGAKAIAGYWSSIWDRLRGVQHETHVSVTYPANGQTGIPNTGWVRSSYQPGSDPSRGGAATRIAAALSYARPFNPRADVGGDIPESLPAGSFTLTERDTGVAVAPMAGFPKVVPYGAESGEHTIAFQPAGDLKPCTWYRADVTSSLVDADGRAVRPASWTFRTSSCPTGQPVSGTVRCSAAGGAVFAPSLVDEVPEGEPNNPSTMTVTAALNGCKGGQDGGTAPTPLPITSGVLTLDIRLPGRECSELSSPSGPTTLRGTIRWNGANGRRVGATTIARGTFDGSTATITTDADAAVLPNHKMRLKLEGGGDGDAAACSTPEGLTTLPLAPGSFVALWPTPK